MTRYCRLYLIFNENIISFLRDVCLIAIICWLDIIPGSFAIHLVLSSLLTRPTARWGSDNIEISLISVPHAIGQLMS
jgi:hypothetical protein